MKDQGIGIIHYSAPPVIGGVEAVIKAHTIEFLRAGYSTTVISGRGDQSAFPAKTNFISIPEIDSNHPEIQSINQHLESGSVPENFEELEQLLTNKLKPIVETLDHLIVHNVLTKHFNLPLTKALFNLNAQGSVKHLIAWCHDFTWTSSSSRSKVHEGDPWDLLRSKWANTFYITISRERQQTLADLLNCSETDIPVIYNGVNPKQLLGLSNTGWKIIQKLGMLSSDINLLMPVRVTKAKNIEFAIETAVSLKEKGVDSRFVLTGPPDPHDADSMKYFQSLVDYRNKLGVQKNFRFIFESGPESGQPFTIDEQIVGDLYRISDMMFMPSHREGFGMPVLEAGLAGIPVLSREVPAANEIAASDAVIFTEETTSREVADIIIQLLKQTSTVRFRGKVRKEYTWQSIFENKVQPILELGRQK
ncbi:MAG: glycosyltransferase family 4 protein [Anaerolineaceae bacterium]|nr:glycosyltransferase family 4 protein [Anaerolineaceae bacterium]